MKENEEKFIDAIRNEMQKNIIKSVGDGFKSCAQQILNMIDNGQNIDDIEKYCSWAISKNDIIVTTINKEEK